MSATDYLYRTLGSLRNLWPAGKPHEFMGHDIADSLAIADHLIAEDRGEIEVAQLIDASYANRRVKMPQFIAALRKLSDAGSMAAGNYRNTVAAMTMGDHHDMGGDYELAAINYVLAYLHSHDRGFMHMAKEIEGRNAHRDAEGYGNAVYWLAQSEGDPAQLLEEMLELKRRTNLALNYYPEEYYEDLIRGMDENPDIRRAMNADFLIYRSAAALHFNLDRDRAWGLYMDGLRSGPTEHALANPFIRNAFED